MSSALQVRNADRGPRSLSYTVLSETMLLASIGGDLRELYGDVAASSQPENLVRLAALIDEHRSEDDAAD